MIIYAPDNHGRHRDFDEGGGQRGGKLLYLIISETVQDKDIVKPTMEYL